MISPQVAIIPLRDALIAKLEPKPTKYTSFSKDIDVESIISESPSYLILASSKGVKQSLLPQSTTLFTLHPTSDGILN